MVYIVQQQTAVTTCSVIKQARLRRRRDTDSFEGSRAGEFL